MHYQISRNGQTYGPYTLDDLQRYLGTGNVLPGDLAKSDEMPDWLPVSEVLTAQPVPAATAYEAPGPGPVVYPQPTAPGYTPIAVNPALANAYPNAPNLHWGLVLLLSVFTCFLFTYVWDIVIAVWLRRVQPSDKSLFWYLGELAITVAQWILTFFVTAALFGHSADHSTLLHLQFAGLAALSKLGSLVSIGLIITANFAKRASLLEHFNGPEPVGLELSGVMTFFFAPWYFQYHLNHINALKQAARYAAPGAS